MEDYPDKTIETCCQCSLTRSRNAPDECDHCGGSTCQTSTPYDPEAEAAFRLVSAIINDPTGVWSESC